MAGVIGSVGSAVGSIAGGIAGANAGAGDIGEARNLTVIANQIIQQLKDAPDISKPLLLQQYRQAGVLTPVLEQQINAQVPGLIKTDQQYKDAQNQALNLLSQRATGGLTSADRAALQEAQQGATGAANAQMQSIDQQLQQRGLANSGSSLAMKLAAAQQGANAAAGNSNSLAQQEQSAREAALSQLGGLSSQLQQNQFNQGFQQQQAQNEMNRFNINNQLSVQARNAQNQNQSNAANLANAQNVSNMNVQNQNNEGYNQLNRQMQQWQANTNLGGMKAGAMQGAAQNLMNMGNQASQNAYNQYAGAGQMLGGIGSAVQSQNNYNKMLDSYNNRTSAMSNSDVNQKASSMFEYNQGGQVQDYRQGGQVQTAHPSQQATVPGDSPRNDKIPAMLSENEIVVPRSLADSKIGKEILKLIHAHNSVKNRLNGND